MAWDTANTKKAYEKLKATGLFNEDELWTAEHWLQEKAYPFSTFTYVGLSPYKAAEITGYSGNYVQTLCKNGEIDCYTDMFGWRSIPVDEIIALKKKRLAYLAKKG